MSPGIWNNFYYSSEEIKKSFNRTNWNSKEVKSLFLDHVDNMSREWVGEIQNPRLIGDVVKADLVIVDQATAIKLAYGAKMGISPKVTGQTEDNENIMSEFLYDNFSVVINPAVKTAWINNMDMAAFEKIRKEKGMSPEEFYAIPMEPASASKLPIYDAAHVRNALARINQIKGVSESELTKAIGKIKAAAKKFNIKIDEGKMEEQNMDSNEEINSVSEMEEVDQDLMDYTDFVKQARKEHPDWSFEEIAAEYKKTQTNAEAEEKVNKLLSLAEQFITLADELKLIKNADKEEEKPKAEDEEEKPEPDAEENKDNVDDKDKEEEKPEDKKEEVKPTDDKEPETKPEEKPVEKEKPKEDKKPEDEEEKMSAEAEELKKTNEMLMQKIEEMNKTHTQTMSQMSEQLNELKKKFDEPDKLSVKTVSMSGTKITEPKFIEGTEDIGFLNTLKDGLGGN